MARLSRRVGAGSTAPVGCFRFVGTGESAGQPGVGRASSRSIAPVMTSVQGQLRANLRCRRRAVVTSRVVAALVLLYAQPITRITPLTTDDIRQQNGEVMIRLGDPPSPVPAPFAQTLVDYTDQRPNTLTATDSRGPVALPRPSGRTAQDTGDPRTPPSSPGISHPAGTYSGDPPSRPSGSRPRDRPDARLPLRDHRPTHRRGPRSLVSLYPGRSFTMTTSL
jgi:hypothetical protein